MKNYYVGETGKRYFQGRAYGRTDEVQQKAARIFLPHVSPSDTVLDFGCGTGGILSAIPCSRRIGVEINEASVHAAREKGIEVFCDLSEVPDCVADVVISHHALEHVLDPLGVLEALRYKLKPEGRIVIVVPVEEPRAAWGRTWHEEQNKHLFCWTALTLGNLLRAAGYDVEEAFVFERNFEQYVQRIRNRPFPVRMLRWLTARLFPRLHTVAVGRVRSSGGNLRDELETE